MQYNLIMHIFSTRKKIDWCITKCFLLFDWKIVCFLNNGLHLKNLLLHVRVGILLTCGKYVHDRIISLRGEVWPYKTCLTRHFLLKCWYQDRKVSGHVPVCYEYWFDLFLRFCCWILEVFRQYGILCFSYVVY